MKSASSGAEEAVRGGEWASELGGHEVEGECVRVWGERLSRGMKGSGVCRALRDDFELAETEEVIGIGDRAEATDSGSSGGGDGEADMDMVRVASSTGSLR